MWMLLLPVTYLVGTFPSASIVARTSGIDIRAVGSKNPGASNVTRSLGWRKGVWVFVLDIAKGASTAGLGYIVAGRPVGYALGAAAVVGHVFPVWGLTRGGKGVATGAGVAGTMAPLAFLILVPSWFVIRKVTKKASVASIVVVPLMPVAVGLVRQDVDEAFAMAGICLLIMIRHVGNIKRLIGRREFDIRN